MPPVGLHNRGRRAAAVEVTSTVRASRCVCLFSMRWGSPGKNEDASQ